MCSQRRLCCCEFHFLYKRSAQGRKHQHHSSVRRTGSSLVKTGRRCHTSRSKQFKGCIGSRCQQRECVSISRLPDSATHGVLVDIVVHTASSMEPRLASNLIDALGHRRKASGEEMYFIHVSPFSICLPKTPLKPNQSSISTMFSAEGGWPYGEVSDTDPILEKEKQIEGSNPVRAVSHSACNVIVYEECGS